MNSLLLGFQQDLSQVSREIETLQTSNNQLTISWKNRAGLQAQLGEVIQQTLVTPDLIRHLLESEINETYLTYLGNLNALMHYVKNNKHSRMRAFRDVGPELERLRNKSAERIRDFLIEKLKPLRQINTNIQMIQTNVLLKYISLNLFLMQWHNDVAQEIRQHYVILVSKYYSLLVEKYIKGLQKRFIPVVERQDLIGVEDLSKDNPLMLTFLKSSSPHNVSSTSSSFYLSSSSSSSSSSGNSKSKNVFALAHRAGFLRDLDAPAIIVHIAEEQDLKFSIEHLFRSLTRMLLDLCSTEYAFCTEFFMNHTKELGAPNAIASAVFQLITDATLKQVLQSIETWFTMSFDLIGLILSMKVHQCHCVLLSQRSLHLDFLTTFMEQIQSILVDRFHQLMDSHIASMKRSKLTSKQVQLHYTTIRLADVMCGILFLNLEPFVPKLLQLRQAYEAFLQGSKTELNSKLDGLAMLILNYDYIVAALEERTNPDATLQSELAHWHKLLHHATMDYVDEALQPEFGYLIQFVNDTELNFESTAPLAFENISHQFNPTWRASLSTLSSEVMRTFSSTKYAPSVLQALLSQVVVFWERYHNLLDKKFKKAPLPFRNQPVGTQNLILEIKKYQTTY